MPKQTLLQKVKKLIQNSPALSVAKRKEWLEKIENMNTDELKTLYTIFANEEKRNIQIKQEASTKLKKRAEEYKTYLNNFQYHVFPKLMKKIEAKDQEIVEEKAEELLKDL